LPHDIEFPGANLHSNSPLLMGARARRGISQLRVAQDQQSEGGIPSSSFAIDGEMRAYSLDVFFLRSS
jgi:hypothetical protein